MLNKNVVRCQGCGKTITINSEDKEFVCRTCGAVNVVPEGNGFADSPLGCISPKGFEWTLPSGVLKSADGKIIYVTAQGTHLSKESFIRIFGCDPEITLANMRKLGVQDIEGYRNLSTLKRSGRL